MEVRANPKNWKVSFCQSNKDEAHAGYRPPTLYRPMCVIMLLIKATHESETSLQSVMVNAIQIPSPTHSLNDS